MEDQDLESLIALLQVPQIGSKTCKTLLHHFGNPSTVFDQLKPNLLKIKGISYSIIDALQAKHTYLDRAKQIIDHALKHEIQILTFKDARYPQRLLEKEIIDMPLILYVKGKANLNSSKMLSIVGTRSSSAYGRKQVRNIIQDSQKYNDLIIISGLAYGIDIEVHKACLDHNIKTIGIMGSGFDHIYPALHTRFADQILVQEGALITEYPYYKQPDRAHFPTRNHIIAGMSDGVIVVESDQKGGSLLTARIAHSYHKTVFAVPGNLTSKASNGTNKLINQNIAVLYLNTEDLDYHLNWDMSTQESNVESQLIFKGLPTDSQLILDLLNERQVCTLNEIADYMSLEISQIMNSIFTLEMDSIIEQTSEGYRLING